DLEHVGGGGLLLEGFAQLIEQPRVLDSDDGLGRERTKQLDVHIAEQASLGPADSNSADGAAFPQHWHCKQCAKTGGKSCVLNLVIRVHANIRNLDDRALMDRPRRASRGARLHRESATQSFDPCRIGAKDGVEMHQFAIETGDSAYLAAAQLAGTFSDKIKYRLRIGRSYRNYAKDFVGRGLSTPIVIQAGKVRDIFGSERHALISEPFHLTAGLPNQCADFPRPPLRPVHTDPSDALALLRARCERPRHRHAAERS